MHVTSEKEKPIRKAARARIRAVPALHEQWKKQQRTVSERISTANGVLFGTCFFFGFPAGMGQATVEAGDVVWNFVMAAALVSLAISIGLANGFRSELSESQFLAICSLLPVSDRRLVNDRIWICARSIVITFLPVLGFFTFFGWKMTQSWEVVGIAAALAAAQAVVHGAFGIILAAWFPRWCNAGILAALITLSFLVVFGIHWGQWQFGLPNVDFVLRPVTMVLPTGWSLMCLIEGGFEGSPVGWFFLIPIASLFIAAVFAARHIQDGYRIIEFELLEGATARVQDERGFSRPPEDELFDFEFEDRPLTDLRAEVRSREFLTTNPEEGGMIERMFYDMLSDEERRSIDVLTGGKILNLTRRVTIVATIVVVFAVAGFVADAWFLGWGGLSLIGVAGWLVGLTLLRRPEAALLSDRSMLQCGTAAFLPVDWPRFHRVVNLAAILQSLFLLPLSFVISGLGLWALRGHLPWFEAISLGFKPLLVLVAMHQFWMQFLIPLDATADRVMGGTKQGCDTLLMIMFGVGAVWLFFTGFSEIWGLVATGLLFGSGWLHRRFYRWLIVTRHTELVAMPPEFESTAGFSR
jgi:hypothetical protein